MKSNAYKKLLKSLQDVAASAAKELENIKSLLAENPADADLKLAVQSAEQSLATAKKAVADHIKRGDKPAKTVTTVTTFGKGGKSKTTTTTKRKR